MWKHVFLNELEEEAVFGDLFRLLVVYCDTAHFGHLVFWFCVCRIFVNVGFELLCFIVYRKRDDTMLDSLYNNSYLSCRNPSTPLLCLLSETSILGIAS